MVLLCDWLIDSRTNLWTEVDFIQQRREGKQLQTKIEHYSFELYLYFVRSFLSQNVVGSQSAKDVRGVGVQGFEFEDVDNGEWRLCSYGCVWFAVHNRFSVFKASIY